MRDYVTHFGDSLIQADARVLPLEEESIEVVLSHMLVNNVSAVRQRAIVREVIRVLRPGGEARLFGFGDDERQLMDVFLKRYFSAKITFQFIKKIFNFTFRGRYRSYTLNLLVLKKTLTEVSTPHTSLTVIE